MIHHSTLTGNGPRPEQPGANDYLAWALHYAHRGWSIIPTKGKKAACKWTEFQRKPATESQLRQLFCQPGVDGLAVILGDASGGLACRDFDDLAAYRTWQTKHPELARTLPTVETARGRHVYFRGPVLFKDCGDGEYRGDSGHYCLLPPSRHPSGHVYKWINPLPAGELPTVDPWESGLMPDGTQRPQEVVSSECPMSSASSVSSVSSEFHCVDDRDLMALRCAIADTQPQCEGQRHRAVFELCRRLKAIPSLADADPAKLRPFVKEWHRLASPIIQTKEFSATWADFLSGWRKVKAPAGQGPIDEAFQRAQKAKPPAKAAHWYPDEPKVILLAALCRELQLCDRNADFFLDCRTAGRLLGVSHNKAWSWLDMLCGDGILELRDKGSLAKHRASQYRYVAWNKAGPQR